VEVDPHPDTKIINHDPAEVKYPTSITESARETVPLVRYEE